MAKAFRVDVVSPEAVVWTGDAEFVATRTTEGEIGILADHEPTMAALATGSAEIDPVAGDRVTIGVHGGFLQIYQNQVTLLSDRAELVDGSKADAIERAAVLAEAEVESE